MATIYDYWLCSIPGVGNRSIDRLLALCGNAEQIYRASKEVLAEVLSERKLEELEKLRKGWNLPEEFERLKEQGIRFITREDAEYPKRLKQIPDAPYGIFYKGRLPEDDVLSVAVIGARDCSEYGRYVAEELGKFLGSSGVQVISGMARGIDGISQDAALRAGGTTTAVLGSGVDVCYPVQNKKLYAKILEQGCIMSSYPPGTMARSQNFPPRNRIVSGLADVVVVIEARNKSGTLITVDMALEQGKEVYVVPGRITDRLSDGCNKLLKQGAGILLSPYDFLEEIRELWHGQQIYGKNAGCENEQDVKENTNRNTERNTENNKKLNLQATCRHISLPQDLQKIYNLLDFTPQSTEQLMGKSGGTLTITELNTRLMRLCLQNLATQQSPGHFSLKR